MRIHSKFRDYYDKVVHYGLDTSIHYIRHEIEVKLSDLQVKIPSELSEFLGLHDFYSGDKHIECVVFIVGFCGKFYPCIRIIGDVYKDIKDVFCYSFEEIKEFFKNRGFTLKKYNEKAISDFLNYRLINDEFFVEIKAPIFRIGHIDVNCDTSKYKDKLFTNIFLKDIEFFKVKDAFTAFQDISMYITNQLVNVKQIEDIPDKYKIIQHGFDEKYGFRKMPKDKK